MGSNNQAVIYLLVTAEHAHHVLVGTHLLHQGLQAAHTAKLFEHIRRKRFAEMLSVHVPRKCAHIALLWYLHALHFAPHLGEPPVLLYHTHHFSRVPTRPSCYPHHPRLVHQLRVCAIQLCNYTKVEISFWRFELIPQLRGYGFTCLRLS